MVSEITSLEKPIGLEVNENDIQELLKRYGQELTSSELIDLHHEQEVMDEISSAEKKEGKGGRCNVTFPQKEKDSIEPMDRSNSISDGESHSTQ